MASVTVEPIIEEEELEEEENGLQDDEDDNDLVVLDPDHPLMDRVQAAIRDQLNKQNEKLEIEMREKQETLKNAKLEREEVGVELYGVQQQLARQQMLIEKEQDNHSIMTHLRKQKEQVLQEVKNMYQKMTDTLKNDREQVISLRSDMETAASRLRYMNEAYETIKKDIALTVRATEKAMVDMSKAQRDKLQQDLYVDLLTRQVQQLEEQIGLGEVQCQAQSQTTKTMKESLAEATMELETLLLEKRKLMHQWNNSLIGMRRRDEAFSAMLTARNVQQEQIHSMETELENYKKSITKEQEKNEQLTLLLKKIDADTTHVKKQMELIASKIEALQSDYTTYTRALQETEQALTVVSGECAIKQSELGGLRTQTERETLEKRRLEDSVMEKMMQRLTMDKATQYSGRSLEKLKKQRQELEISLANVENLISKTSLDSSNITASLKNLQKTMEDMNTSIQQQNDLITKSEAEIGRNNALIERKQTQIDQLNRKIKAKMSKLGGQEDLGPLEMKISGLQKQISDSMEQCSQMQQHWLRQQRELVKKTQSLDEQTQAIATLQKEELILTQKKLRLDANLANEHRQYSNIQRSIESLQKDMIRLNALITDRKGEQDKLEQGNVLMEKDFVSSLKESELEFLKLQASQEQLNEEKDRLLNGLEESEHQIMLWERKTQLAREMKESVDSESGQAEIKAMRAEIHRMQVRHSQLMRQQEKMIQDMEKAVYRREAIIQRSDAQVKSGKKDQTQAHYKKKIVETQRHIKQAQKGCTDYQQQLDEMHSSQSNIVKELHERQDMSDRAKGDLVTIEAKLQETEAKKQTDMSDLLALQAKVKHLTAAKDGKYKLLYKSDESRNAEMQRQKEKLQALWSLAQKLETECSGTLHQKLSSLSNILKSKLQSLQLQEAS